jgi:hypothetical protein
VDVTLTPRSECRGLPKGAWIVLVAATFVAGAVVWLAFRRPGWPTASPAALDGDDEPPSPGGCGAAPPHGVRAAQPEPGCAWNGPGSLPGGPGSAGSGTGTGLGGPGNREGREGIGGTGAMLNGPGIIRNRPDVMPGLRTGRDGPADRPIAPTVPPAGPGWPAGGTASGPGGCDIPGMSGSLEAEAALLRHPAGRSRPPGAARPLRPLGPDDDPDFLRSLGSSIHGAEAGGDPPGSEED